MEKLNYSELVFVEDVLTYYLIREIREMKQYPDMYSDKEITEFRLSVQELIDKIERIRKGE